MDDTVTMPTIEVNGQRQQLAALTVVALLEERGIDVAGRGIAIAVNGAVVPRSAWATTALKAGDAVEIVQAKQGG
jgi:sulfur carrier protein